MKYTFDPMESPTAVKLFVFLGAALAGNNHTTQGGHGFEVDAERNATGAVIFWSKMSGFFMLQKITGTLP